MIDRRVSAFILLSLSFTSCGKKKDDDKAVERRDGLSLKVPKVAQVVAAATPAGLLSGASLRLEGMPAVNPAQSLKTRVFSPGPVAIMQRLQGADEAMAGYKARIDGKIAPCLADYTGDVLTEKAPIAYANTVDLNGDGSKTLDLAFTEYLNCAEKVGTAWRAFGTRTDDGKKSWFMHEAGGPAGGGYAIRVADDASEAEVWYAVGHPKESGSQVLGHLKKSADGTIEYTHTGSAVGYDCGLRLVAKSNLMFVVVAADKEVLGGDGSCTGDGVAKDVAYCIDGSTTDFTVKDASVCEAAGLTAASFTLPSLSHEVADHDQVTRAFTEARPATIPDLTLQDPPAK